MGSRVLNRILNADHFESRKSDTGPRRQGPQGMALLELNPQFECLRWGCCIDCHLEDLGLCGWICMNSNSLCRVRSPHILLQPLLTEPWQSPMPLPFGLWRKKKPFNFLGHRIQVGSRLCKELTHWGKKACKREQVMFTLWWTSARDRKEGLSCPPGVRTGLCFWLLWTVSNSSVHLRLRGRRRSLSIYGISDFPRAVFVFFY